MRVFHVFTDRLDEYPSSLRKARAIVREWKRIGYVRFRIYRLVETKGRDEETLLYAEGDYPI
jgi:hypothetical protein